MLISPHANFWQSNRYKIELGGFFHVVVLISTCLCWVSFQITALLDFLIWIACSQFFKKFIHFWLRWVFVAARGLPLVAASGGYSSLRCAGFSLRWLLLLQSMGSRRAGFISCGSWALERRLSSYGTWA